MSDSLTELERIVALLMQIDQLAASDEIKARLRHKAMSAMPVEQGEQVWAARRVGLERDIRGALVELPRQTAREISDRIGANSGSVSSILARLVKRGEARGEEERVDRRGQRGGSTVRRVFWLIEK